jgi:hypothetical protein
MTAKWNDLNLTEKVGRMNQLKAAINRNGRLIDDEDILMLATQNYLISDHNIKMLVEGRAGIDELRNTRQV